MELKPGYKLTEVGVVPEEWNVEQVSSLLTSGPKNGYSGRSSKDAQGTPTLSLSATSSGTMLLNDETVKRLEERINERSDLFLQPGDVLVQRSNTLDLVGTTAVFNGSSGIFIYPDLMMRLRFREEATAHWFWRYANSAKGRRYFVSVAAGSSGSMPKISGKKLRSMQMPVPPLPEQRSIATALSDMDELLGACDRLIAKKRDLKQSTMQQLLTGKTRLTGFGEGKGYKETEVGLIPEDWLTLKIGDLFSFKNGLNKSKEFFGRGTPIINYMDVFENPGLYESDILGKVSVSTDETRAYAVRKGDVFFTRTSETVEEIGITTVLLEDIENGVFSGFVLRARPKNPDLDFDLLFKKYCFDSAIIRKQITSTSSYTTRALTNGRLLSQVTLPCPSNLKEQHEIATVLSDMDAEITALEQRRDKTRAIKQAMMQELLTGRIRLV